MTRSVKEWVGRDHDSKIPPRIRLRCFERAGGICFLSGRKISAGEPWDLHHKVALINGGENRESNLVPVLKDKHKEQTARDVAEKSRLYKKRVKHLGASNKRPWNPGLRKRMNGKVEFINALRMPEPHND